MEIILISILFILLTSILVLFFFNKIKHQTYKPISEKLLGTNIDNYIQKFRSHGKYKLLAITSKSCSVCHTYLNQIQEDMKKEEINISVAELQFNNSSQDKDLSSPHEIFYGDAKLRKYMKIKQYPLYLLIDDKGTIREIFITENIVLNYMRKYFVNKINNFNIQ